MIDSEKNNNGVNEKESERDIINKSSNDSSKEISQNEFKVEDTLYQDTIINLSFFGLGASSFAIVKVPYHISIILTIFLIVIIGLLNNLNYIIIADLYEEKKENKENKKKRKNIV